MAGTIGTRKRDWFLFVDRGKALKCEYVLFCVFVTNIQIYRVDLDKQSEKSIMNTKNYSIIRQFVFSRVY